MVSPADLRPSQLIFSLPKAELHLHLEGSIRPRTIFELQQRRGIANPTLEQAEQFYRYQDFAEFLLSFKAVTELLRTPEDYELITYRLMEQLKSENVLHAEVYISAGVILWRKQNFEALFEGMERGRQLGERDFGVSLLWIFDATRHFGVEEARKVAELAVRHQNEHVVGFGIGGDERRAAPELFQDVYSYCRENGLRLTAHAGETTGPESIWGALNLKAERLGHCLSAARDPELIEELSQRQVPIEICLTSNLRTGCCTAINEHPVRNYFDHGLMISLNTDDPAMFGTSLSREYQLAQDNFGFTDEHLRELARNSFEASFLPAEKKLEFLNLFDAATART
jgi:adenosine deaminase/aminodeoxyfutalosine deaminase